MNIQNQPPKDLPEAAVYLVRRACRLGTARRQDMLPHFQASQSTYTRWMVAALSAAPCLDKSGSGGGTHLILKDTQSIPSWASFESLLKELENGNSADKTGIEDHELPVYIPKWTRNTPVDPRALREIIQCIHQEQILNLRYIGLRKYEEAQWRAIYPVGLERMGDQWRLVALDMEKEGYPLRIFVLARILGAEKSERKLPKNFSKPGLEDVSLSIHALLNPDLTSDQAIALSNELRIQDGEIQINKRTEFEFYRRFGAQALSDTAVWPPLMNKKEEKPCK